MRLYELSVALKYIKPNVRQLSSSIISLISIIVISLVVWLIVVFLSVSWGLEKSWVGKLISLTAPVRITPTDAYYNSYYYQIDSLSGNSSYAPKSIKEKLLAESVDPYESGSDLELPGSFPKPDLGKDGTLKDLIKLAFQEVEAIPGATPYDYARAYSTLTLTLLRQNPTPETSFFKHNVYVGSGAQDAPRVKTSVDDLNNTLFSLSHRLSEGDVLLSERSDIRKKRFIAFHEALNTTPGDLKDARFERIPESFKDQNRLWTALESTLDGIEPILVPKSFKEAGILAGDRGNLSYIVPSAETPLELKMPIIVAGFYDPGIIPLGGRFILARDEALPILQSTIPDEMRHESAGIGVKLQNLADAENVKKRLEARFQELGIGEYFKVETYREYDYAKDIITQLQSEKNLFSMLALIILLVACSNIISMLIILVNDKKEEIGILRSMGATSISIAAIFGTTGIILGFSGSLIGIVLAVATLSNLNSLINAISRIQGYEMFNPLIYGDTLPNELSIEALLFVVGATGLISLIAGFVPACKACLLKPYEILKAE